MLFGFGKIILPPPFPKEINGKFIIYAEIMREKQIPFKIIFEDK